MEFNAAETLRESDDRAAQINAGGKLVPIATAIIAVFAAIATVVANHDSVIGLKSRTQAGITQIKAADQYSNYEAKRVKAEVNEALMQAGLVTNPASLQALRARITSENSDAQKVLTTAHAQELESERELSEAERSMRAYEFHEIAAALFEVAIIMVSITALLRRSNMLLVVGCGATLMGLGFFIRGLLP